MPYSHVLEVYSRVLTSTRGVLMVLTGTSIGYLVSTHTLRRQRVAKRPKLAPTGNHQDRQWRPPRINRKNGPTHRQAPLFATGAARRAKCGLLLPHRPHREVRASPHPRHSCRRSPAQRALLSLALDVARPRVVCAASCGTHLECMPHVVRTCRISHGECLPVRLGHAPFLSVWECSAHGYIGRLELHDVLL